MDTNRHAGIDLHIEASPLSKDDDHKPSKHSLIIVLFFISALSHCLLLTFINKHLKSNSREKIVATPATFKLRIAPTTPPAQPSPVIQTISKQILDKQSPDKQSPDKQVQTNVNPPQIKQVQRSTNETRPKENIKLDLTFPDEFDTSKNTIYPRESHIFNPVLRQKLGNTPAQRQAIPRQKIKTFRSIQGEDIIENNGLCSTLEKRSDPNLPRLVSIPQTCKHLRTESDKMAHGLREAMKRRRGDLASKNN